MVSEHCVACRFEIPNFGQQPAHFRAVWNGGRCPVRAPGGGRQDHWLPWALRYLPGRTRHLRQHGRPTLTIGPTIVLRNRIKDVPRNRILCARGRFYKKRQGENLVCRNIDFFSCLSLFYYILRVSNLQATQCSDTIL